MTPKFKTLAILFLFLLAFLPSRIVSADTGPKPTMQFEFKQELPSGQVTITSGIMYECEQADCSDAKPLAVRGPQHFTCDTSGCRVLAYGFSPYHRLEIQFSDGKTRLSNIFETGGFDSVYQVTVHPDNLLVELKYATVPPTEEFLVQPQSNGDGFPRTAGIILAWICVITGGLALIGLIIFAVRRSAKK